MRRITLIVILIISFNSFAAGPLSHIVFADLYLKTVYPKKYLQDSQAQNKKMYLIGALFPDIRYLGTLRREETHFWDNDYQNMSLAKGFVAGMRNHSFIDMFRERFAVVYGIYNYLDDIKPSDQATFLKLVEDEILFKKYKNYKINDLTLLTSINNSKVSEQEIQRWYNILNKYFTVGPLRFIQELAKNKLDYFGISTEKLSGWSEKISKYVNDKRFLKYCDKLFAAFEEAFIFIESDRGKLFNEDKFRAWLREFSKVAIQAGIDEKTVKKEFKNVLFNPRVLYKDRNQANNLKLVSQDMINEWMQVPEHSPSSTRFSLGKFMLNKYNKDILFVENKLDVDKETLLAIWGTEFKFGYAHCNYEALDSILTLAYDGRRKLFHKEAIALLKLISKGNIIRPQPSSWAGAIGQVQFLPSNISAYAISYKKGNTIDLINSVPDIMSSIALFLSSNGYEKNIPIGQLVNIRNGDQSLHKGRFKLSTIKRNLEPVLGEWLINDNEIVEIVNLPNKNLPKLLVTKNYRALMKWNKSDLFGMQ
ncbi:MAG: lytic murein transglycosylase, partial [Legionellales bacterium]|nr:lytic murein transglycosylase [Legionellales bacterium]